MSKSSATPKFGRLMIVCVATAIFCGLLTWFMATHVEDCCDLSFLSKIIAH